MSECKFTSSSCLRWHFKSSTAPFKPLERKACPRISSWPRLGQGCVLFAWLMYVFSTIVLSVGDGIEATCSGTR